MKLLNQTVTKQKCDAFNCKNDAAVYFSVKGRANRCYLCKDCVQSLAKDVLSAVIPKSPQNTIKRISDKREQEKNAIA